LTIRLGEVAATGRKDPPQAGHEDTAATDSDGGDETACGVSKVQQ